MRGAQRARHGVQSRCIQQRRSKEQRLVVRHFCFFQKALQKRRDVVDLLRGTNLQPMAEDRGFWAFRLENAFHFDMHNRLVTLMNQSFDPTKGFLKLCAEKRDHMQTRLQCAEHVQAPLCVCRHVFRSLEPHHRAVGAQFQGVCCTGHGRPQAPGRGGGYGRMASNRIVEESLGHKPREGEYEAQRHYA